MKFIGNSNIETTEFFITITVVGNVLILVQGKVLKTTINYVGEYTI